MATIEEQVARNIKAVMKRTGDTVNSISDKTGLPYNNIKRRLVDGRGIELYEAARIADALGVDLSEILSVTRPQALKATA